MKKQIKIKIIKNSKKQIIKPIFKTMKTIKVKVYIMIKSLINLKI